MEGLLNKLFSLPRLIQDPAIKQVSTLAYTSVVLWTAGVCSLPTLWRKLNQYIGLYLCRVVDCIHLQFTYFKNLVSTLVYTSIEPITAPFLAADITSDKVLISTLAYTFCQIA